MNDKPKGKAGRPKENKQYTHIKVRVLNGNDLDRLDIACKANNKGRATFVQDLIKIATESIKP